MDENVIQSPTSCMHNMIVEEEGDNVTTWCADESSSTTSSFVVNDPLVQVVSLDMRNVVARSTEMGDEEAHTRLQEDLIEEIWMRANVFQH